jgi:hypothetical protein
MEYSRYSRWLALGASQDEATLPPNLKEFRSELRLLHREGYRTKPESVGWGIVEGRLAARRLRYASWGKAPLLADQIELIRALYTTPNGYDADAVRQAIAEFLTHPEPHVPLDKLDYQDFLETDYWRDLSRRMKERCNYTCQRCGLHRFPCEGGLNVHHKTYAHRGSEYPDHVDDLEVLCEDCHQEKHDPLAAEANPDDIPW